jgi:RNA polymerase subunit RPABC4/transcription elongation factor Spt4
MKKPTIIECEQCKAKVVASAKKCPKCKSSLKDISKDKSFDEIHMIECPTCSKITPKDSGICIHCKSSLFFSFSLSKFLTVNAKLVNIMILAILILLILNFLTGLYFQSL